MWFEFRNSALLIRFIERRYVLSTNRQSKRSTAQSPVAFNTVPSSNIRPAQSLRPIVHRLVDELLHHRNDQSHQSHGHCRDRELHRYVIARLPARWLSPLSYQSSRLYHNEASHEPHLRWLTDAKSQCIEMAFQTAKILTGLRYDGHAGYKQWLLDEAALRASVGARGHGYYAVHQQIDHRVQHHIGKRTSDSLSHMNQTA
jgi:hypothetical protein